MRGRALCFGHFSGHTRVPLTHTHTHRHTERGHTRADRNCYAIDAFTHTAIIPGINIGKSVCVLYKHG